MSIEYGIYRTKHCNGTESNFEKTNYSSLNGAYSALEYWVNGTFRVMNNDPRCQCDAEVRVKK